jgi:L-ascorbate metabolism protein UlaG (beta-lactamase superfamily)
VRFKNEFDSSGAVTLLGIFKWQFLKKRTRSKEISSLELKADHALLDSREDFICWLGHASFLVQLNETRFLFDPVFANVPFYKRKFPSPYCVEELGEIDYIFISHVHYDHFDKPSIKALLSKNVEFILPLGMECYVKQIDKNAVVHSLEWFETYVIEKGLKLSFVPSKHWGRRGAFDTNKALWGGCVLESETQSIYFAGDTAYDKHFKEIGEQYTIDYALLPVGAYNPTKVMKHNHTNPQEAYNAYQDLKAKYMIPMHYGTFKLTDEPLNEPSEWVDLLVEEHGADICKVKVGEVKFISNS